MHQLLTIQNLNKRNFPILPYILIIYTTFLTRVRSYTFAKKYTVPHLQKGADGLPDSPNAQDSCAIF